MKSNSIAALALVAVAAYIGVKENNIDLDLGKLLSSEAKVVAPTLAEPTGDNKVIADEVAAKLQGKPEEALALGQLWWGIGQMVGDRDKEIVSTDHVRKANEISGALNFGGRKLGTGLGSTVEDGLTKALGGKENRKLSSEDRQKVEDYFLAIAWGALNAK